MNEAVREEAAAWMELLNLWLNAFYGIFMAIVVQYIICWPNRLRKSFCQR